MPKSHLVPEGETSALCDVTGAMGSVPDQRSAAVAATSSALPTPRRQLRGIDVQRVDLAAAGVRPQLLTADHDEPDDASGVLHDELAPTGGAVRGAPRATGRSGRSPTGRRGTHRASTRGIRAGRRARAGPRARPHRAGGPSARAPRLRCRHVPTLDASGGDWHVHRHVRSTATSRAAASRARGTRCGSAGDRTTDRRTASRRRPRTSGRTPRSVPRSSWPLPPFLGDGAGPGSRDPLWCVTMSVLHLHKRHRTPTSACGGRA